MQRILGGVLGLIVFAVVAFLIIGASQQLELRVLVPPGVEAFIDQKPFLPCKHEDRPKGQNCDPLAVEPRQYRWFVNGGRSHHIKVVGQGGSIDRTVEMKDSTISIVVVRRDGRLEFADPDG